MRYAGTSAVLHCSKCVDSGRAITFHAGRDGDRCASVPTMLPATDIVFGRGGFARHRACGGVANAE